MATVVPVTTFPYETSLDVAVTTWYGMGKDDDGEPVQLAVFLIALSRLQGRSAARASRSAEATAASRITRSPTRQGCR